MGALSLDRLILLFVICLAVAGVFSEQIMGEFTYGISKTVNSYTTSKVDVVSIFGKDNGPEFNGLDELKIEVRTVSEAVEDQVNLTNLILGIDTFQPIFYKESSMGKLSDPSSPQPYELKQLLGDDDLLLEGKESFTITLYLKKGNETFDLQETTSYTIQFRTIDSQIPHKVSLYVPVLPKTNQNQYIKVYP